MSGGVVAVIIVGFFALVVGLILYSVLIDQPRLHRKLQEESAQRGWTYTPGKSLVVTQRSSSGYLVSPQETISQSFQGKDAGINWRMDMIAVARKYTRLPGDNRHREESGESTLTHHTFWQTEDVRIDHGAVLLFVKPCGWNQSGSASGILKSTLESIHTNLLYSILRTNWGIQNTPVSFDAPEFEAKYSVEASDLGAAKGALTPALRDFFVNHRPPDSLIQIGDNGLRIVVSDATYERSFEKMVTLVDFGVQLANTVRASQSVPTPIDNPKTTDSQTL